MGHISMIYGAIAALSVLLLTAYSFGEKKKERNFLYLFICVALTNSGYFLLSAAPSLRWAMTANRLSYLGTAYSVLAMVFIVSDVCQIQRRKWRTAVLTGISTAAFLLAASGDWSGLYYRSVEIATVNGVTQLIKTYGPLHILYTFYLVAYILLMIAMIVYAAGKQRLASPKYAVFLIMTVIMNMGVWAVEQMIRVDFEFLSVSYIVTEVILLLIYGVLRDYGIVQSGGSIRSVQMLTQSNAQNPATGELPPDMEDLLCSFAEKTEALSAAERRILNYYIEGYETADIPELAFVSIHTVKKHNHSIYQKLGVASRDELMLYIELFRCCGRLQELTGEKTETQ